MKTGGWWKASITAAAYLLVFGSSELVSHVYLSRSQAEFVEWVLFLSSAVLVAFLVHRNFANIWRSKRKQREIAKWFSAIGGKEFFPLLAGNLVRALNAGSALICEIADEEENKLRSLAAVCHGRQLETFECSWAGTPAEEVLREKRLVYLPRGVRERFALTELPKEVAAESFLGTPMIDVSGRVIGLVVLLDDRPLLDRDGAEEILPLFAVRAAAELERRRSEEALRESEERFRATFNQASVGIGHVDPEGRWLRVNRKYCDIIGYTVEEVQSLNIIDITHPDDREKTRKQFSLLMEGAIDDYSMEKRYIRKDGSIVWVNITASKVTDTEGKPMFFVGVVEDITARKQAEKALHYSEARFRALYRDNPAMIFTLGADWNILSANPVCARHLGYETEELEGISALGIFHEDDRSAVADQLRSCLLHPGQVYRWQFRKVRKDGKMLWVEEIAQGVFGPDGSPNILVVCQDISDRKRAEEEIERLNASLMARAAEMEDANRELETFNYAVAHDLRKPLAAVNGYCQILQEMCGHMLDGKCSSYLKEAYEATWRMNQLIDTLLNFAHLTAVRLHREEVDLSSMARTVSADLSVLEPKRRADFRIAEGITVTGDASLLRVALENLLGNAWKYTSKREEAIIEFGVAQKEGRETFFVRDNGSGFDMADVEKLFIPFQRLHPTEEFVGHGIGLAIVERIIRRHGGRIWAEGEKGKGATFFFTLAAD